MKTLFPSALLCPFFLFAACMHGKKVDFATWNTMFCRLLKGSLHISSLFFPFANNTFPGNSYILCNCILTADLYTSQHLRYNQWHLRSATAVPTWWGSCLLIIAHSGSVERGWINWLLLRKDITSVFPKDLSIHDIKKKITRYLHGNRIYIDCKSLFIPF